jgi:hypothetical protein
VTEIERPVVDVSDGSITITGHRWRVEVILESGVWQSPEGARDALVLVSGGGGGDSSEGELGALGAIDGGPVESLPVAAHVGVGAGGPPGVKEDGTTGGQRGHDGIALVWTRW